jgi:hypothetical protein
MKKAHTEEVFFLTFNISKLHIESIELPITPSYNKTQTQKPKEYAWFSSPIATPIQSLQSSFASLNFRLMLPIGLACLLNGLAL